jgi:exopolysaccharide biosynthesis protein
LCHLLGHQDAMTLDGGGSAVLAVEGVSRLDGLTETVPLGVVNIPSDGHGKERLLPVLLTVVSE